MLTVIAIQLKRLKSLFVFPPCSKEARPQTYQEVAVSRKPDESYWEFIDRVNKNLLAAKVKILDLLDNMDLSRIPNPSEKDSLRVRRYKKALDILVFGKSAN